jgi:hypothetical protein
LIHNSGGIAEITTCRINEQQEAEAMANMAKALVLLLLGAASATGRHEHPAANSAPRLG